MAAACRGAGGGRCPVAQGVCYPPFCQLPCCQSMGQPHRQGVHQCRGNSLAHGMPPLGAPPGMCIRMRPHSAMLSSNSIPHMQRRHAPRSPCHPHTCHTAALPTSNTTADHHVISGVAAVACTAWLATGRVDIRGQSSMAQGVGAPALPKGW